MKASLGSARADNLPSVAVIIPCKNAEKSIGKCLSSVLASWYPKEKMRIIVVDSSSNLRTIDVLRKFAKEYSSMLKIFHENNLKISEAYNYALKSVDDEIVAFVDADCVVRKDWLKIIVDNFDEPEIAAVGGFYETPSEANFFSRLVGLELESRTVKFEKYVTRLPTGNIAFRREILERIGGFDGELPLHQDTDIGYRIIKNGYKLVYNRNASVFHYHRSSPSAFFRQQFSYALYAPELYIKHPNGVKGDHITSFSMNIEPLIFLASGGLFFLSTFLHTNLYLVGLLLLCLPLILYFHRTIKIFRQTSQRLSFVLPVFFLLRGIAWALGLIASPFALIKNRVSRALRK